MLTYTPEKRDESDREKVLIRLTPRALHELWIEVRDLDVEARQMGHRAECDLCEEMVDLDRAIPNARGEACHKRYWAEYTGAPDWFSDYVSVRLPLAPDVGGLEAVPLVRVVDGDDLQHAHLLLVLQERVDGRVGPSDVHPVPVAAAVDGELLLVTPAATRIRDLRQVPEFLLADPLGLLVGDVEELAGVVTEQDVVLRHPRGASTRRGPSPLTSVSAVSGPAAGAAEPAPSGGRRRSGRAPLARGAPFASLRSPEGVCRQTWAV